MSPKGKPSSQASDKSTNFNHKLATAADPEAGSQGAVSDDEKNGAPESPHDINGPRWVIVVVAVLLSTFLYALDNTIVANIRPSIIASLGQIEKLPWVSVAYAAGEVGSNPFWGSNYGRFNIKWLFIASVVIFEVGSAVCGSSQTINALIVGRTVAGIGGSGIYIGTINLLSSLTHVSKRPLYLSFVGMAWSIGTVLGPIIGGAFADSDATWRWAFYLNLCFAAVTLPVYLWLLPSHQPEPASTTTQRIKRIDFLGLLLFVGGTLCIIMAIDFGGAIYNWSSGQIISLFVISAILWTLFSLQQAFSILTTNSTRLFPIQYIASYEMCILFAQTSTAIASIIIPIYFIPLIFQFAHGASALSAGVRTLPFIFAAVAGAMINGALFAKLNLYMPWFAIGGSLIALGGGLLSSVSLHTAPAHIYGYSVITGVGAGLIVQAPYAVAQAKHGLDAVPSVTAFISCGQMAGVALSLGIGSSVLVNQAADGIGRLLPEVPRRDVQASIAGAGAEFLQSVPSEKRDEVLAVVAATVGNVFYMVVAGGVLAVVLSLFMKRERMPLG